MAPMKACGWHHFSDQTRDDWSQSTPWVLQLAWVREHDADERRSTSVQIARPGSGRLRSWLLRCLWEMPEALRVVWWRGGWGVVVILSYSKDLKDLKNRILSS